MAVRVIQGDCREVLLTLESGSVQCCVTSPPYYGLRDYGHTAQLGLEKTPAEYVEKMVQVFRDVRRVLRDDGTLWLNCGDSYASGGERSTGRNDANRETPGGRGGSFRGGIRRATGQRDGCKPKDLIGIPWMLAFALRADGWYLRSDIIWAKPNPMPESVTDRPTKSHEYLFLLSKSERYFYDADAISEASIHAGKTVTNDNGKNGQMGQYGQTRGGFMRPEGVLVKSHRNARSVWTVSTQPYSGAHFATFPPKLIEPCILAGSARQACEHCGKAWERQTRSERVQYPNGIGNGTENKQVRAVNGVGSTSCFATGEGTTRVTLGFAPSCGCGSTNPVPSTVLDPFGGAGTTGLVADRLGRDSILCELNEQYAEMARNRITDDAPLFSGEVA